MYQYTKDIVTVDGKLKAVSWQATPGLYAYRRDLAKTVLGSDDPATVQAALADWTKFDAVAKTAHDKGIYMARLNTRRIWPIWITPTKSKVLLSLP